MGNTNNFNNSNEKGRNAICILQKPNVVHGVIGFHQCNPLSPVKILFRLNGPSNEIHAIHIHEYGDMTNGCDSMGKHFNPTQTTHGSYHYADMPRHAGDLINNIKFDRNGKFEYAYEDASISLYDDVKNIIGRSIVIHEGQDDLGKGVGDKQKESLISGNAGKRIACGIIGVSQPMHI
jgi:Cu-Zn family superoxide dismutase